MSNPYNTPNSPLDLRNLIIAVVLCSGLLFVWQVYYQQPQIAARQAAQRSQLEAQQKMVVSVDAISRGDVVLPGEKAVGGQSITLSDDVSDLPRERLLSISPRVTIDSPDALHGSINLVGLRFDDLTLVRHRVSVEKDSPEVTLLTPAQSKERHFVQIGWLAAAGERVEVPNASSLWQASGDRLTPESPVTLHWVNNQGVTFRVHVALDKDYLFTLRQEVVNSTGESISVMPYGLINHAVPQGDKFGAIIHQGPLGVFDGKLVETSYGDLKDDGKESFNGTKGWVGVADKYWLTAFMPPQDVTFNSNFQFLSPHGHDRTQVDYLSPARMVPAGQTDTYTLHVFAGAKELNVLDRYRDGLNLPLFDRALDFGVLYFLTRPIFLTLDYFYGLIGNFGLAIMLLVVVLKVLLFPLSNKSYRSMAQMRALQPKIEEIRKEAGDDKLKAQQETMKLWQKEKVNPVSGCLPLLLQIPIFFALYKVLMVSIEMRHAPFYGWIQDLSAADPSNLFTFFGLVEWPHPAILHLGAWPIIMALTMHYQQKMNPKPADPMQAKVMGWLPVIFLVLFVSFPAGLLIYWAWNNVLSILQQWFINRSYEKHKVKVAAKIAKTEQ